MTEAQPGSSSVKQRCCKFAPSRCACFHVRYASDIKSTHDNVARHGECVRCAPELPTHHYWAVTWRLPYLAEMLQLSEWTWGMGVSQACASLSQTRFPLMALRVKMEAAERALLPCQRRAPAAKLLNSAALQGKGDLECCAAEHKMQSRLHSVRCSGTAMVNMQRTGQHGAEQRMVQKMLTCVTKLVGADVGSSQKMPNSGKSCS